MIDEKNLVQEFYSVVKTIQHVAFNKFYFLRIMGNTAPVPEFYRNLK